MATGPSFDDDGCEDEVATVEKRGYYTAPPGLSLSVLPGQLDEEPIGIGQSSQQGEGQDAGPSYEDDFTESDEDATESDEDAAGQPVPMWPATYDKATLLQLRPPGCASTTQDAAMEGGAFPTPEPHTSTSGCVATYDSYEELPPPGAPNHWPAMPHPTPDLPGLTPWLPPIPGIVDGGWSHHTPWFQPFAPPMGPWDVPSGPWPTWNAHYVYAGPGQPEPRDVTAAARPVLPEGSARLSLRLAVRAGTAARVREGARASPKGRGPRAGRNHIFKNKHLGSYIYSLLNEEFSELRQEDLASLTSDEVYIDHNDNRVSPKACIGSITILVLSEHRYSPDRQQISWKFDELGGTTFPGAQTFLLAVDEKDGKNPFIIRLLEVIKEKCKAEVLYEEVGFGDFRL